MKLATARLTEIAVINPSMTSESTGTDEPVAFAPMAAVFAESATVTVSETRAFSSVQNGFSYFQDGDILVAKITPCFENGKIPKHTSHSVMVLDQPSSMSSELLKAVLILASCSTFFVRTVFGSKVNGR